MGSKSKTFALALILIIAISSVSLLMMKPAFAQSPTPTPIPIPTPSVPTFTVQLVGPPVRVNTTYSLDQNTGQIVANIGYTFPYSYIVLTVKNQPFNPSYGSLYYNVQVKNQKTGWTVINWDDNLNPEQSTGSDYTTITLIGAERFADTQTDIQVQAMLGDDYYGHSPNPPFLQGVFFDGVTGPWSSTQTVNVPANIPLSPTPAPSSSTSTLTPTPTLTSVSSAPKASLSLITTIFLVVIAVLVATIISLLFYIRKRNRLFGLIYASLA